MKKTRQYNQQEEPEQCKSELEGMYLSKPGNWISISENTGAMQQIIPLKKPLCESSRNKEKHKTTKLLNEKDLINDDSAKALKAQIMN